MNSRLCQCGSPAAAERSDGIFRSLCPDPGQHCLVAEHSDFLQMQTALSACSCAPSGVSHIPLSWRRGDQQVLDTYETYACLKAADTFMVDPEKALTAELAELKAGCINAPLPCSCSHCMFFPASQPGCCVTRQPWPELRFASNQTHAEMLYRRACCLPRIVDNAKWTRSEHCHLRETSLQDTPE